MVKNKKNGWTLPLRWQYLVFLWILCCFKARCTTKCKLPTNPENGIQDKLSRVLSLSLSPIWSDVCECMRKWRAVSQVTISQIVYYPVMHHKVTSWPSQDYLHLYITFTFVYKQFPCALTSSSRLNSFHNDTTTQTKTRWPLRSTKQC